MKVVFTYKKFQDIETFWVYLQYEYKRKYDSGL